MGQEIRDLWDFDDPAGSELRFRQAAADAGPATAPLLLTQVARALGLQERFAESQALLDTLRPAPDEPAELRVRWGLEQGRLLRSSGDPGAARPYFEDAAATAREASLGDLQLDSLHMIALIEPTPERQVEANLAALEAARGSSDPGARRWTASVLNNLGCALVDAGRPSEALEVFEEALAERAQHGDGRETQIARWMVGWALRLVGRTDDARTVQLALKAELDAAGIDDPYVDRELQLLESGSPST